MSKEAEAALDRDPLAFLVAPEAADAFLAGTWEQQPAVFKATPERRAFFEGLASFSQLAHVARICEGEGEPLEFGVDVNAARYVDGRRETPNGEVGDSACLERLFNKEGCTMQFHQPQRFCDSTWRLLAAMERRLGCLVGCNAYLTPPGTQGLAPHWDDVEIFVVQTEGSKRWRLHRAPPAPDGAAPTSRASLLAHSHLANQVSGDLEPGEIGEPFMEFTLEVGDVLYMPRGTIHCATAQQGGPSGHLTISTYQRWSAADLLQYGVSVALANPSLQPLLPAPLKAGLPHGFLAAATLGPAAAAELAAGAGGFGEDGTAAILAAAAGGGGADGKAVSGSGDVQQLAAQVAAACRALADCLEGRKGGAGLGPRLLTTAADAMAEDFMRHRLPPHPEQLPPPGPPPTLADAVQCVGASYFRLVPMNTKEEGGCGPDCDEDHEHGHGHDHAHGPACGSGCQEPHHGHGSSDEEEEDEGEANGRGHGGGGGVTGAPPAWVRLVGCLRNDRSSHMMSGGAEEEEEEGLSDEEDASGSDSGSEGEGEDAAELAARAAAAAAALGRKRKQPAAADGGGSEGEEEEEGGSSSSDDDDDGDVDDDDDKDDPREDLVFPAEFAPALVQLLRSAADAGGAPLPVAAIALPAPELQLQVAATLWEAGVLRTVQARKKGKQAAKAAGEKKGRKSATAKHQDQGGKAAKGGPQPKHKKQKA
ncbi:hypothetical protein ABPG77_000164 [Micractinium sp. CCAP 211/92]